MFEIEMPMVIFFEEPEPEYAAKRGTVRRLLKD
jgi:hypothetical protein